jgi:hypothetical protein
MGFSESPCFSADWSRGGLAAIEGHRPSADTAVLWRTIDRKIAEAKCACCDELSAVQFTMQDFDIEVFDMRPNVSYILLIGNTRSVFEQNGMK